MSSQQTSTMLQNIHDTRAVIAAIEHNTAEFLLAMGSAGGGDEVRSASLTWTIGGSPIDYHNAVVQADLAPETADAAIQQVIDKLNAHQVPGTWHLGPSMRPDDLAQRLESHGFKNGGGEPGMAIYIPGMTETPVSPDFRVETVHDAADLDLWRKTLAVDFGEGEREASWCAEVYSKLGYGDDSAWRHYIGYLNGDPVATTTLFMDGHTAGIYFVMTVPAARRQGIGAAITAHALRDAEKSGFRVGVLGASSAGQPVYERLGFRTFCDLLIYEWRR